MKEINRFHPDGMERTKFHWAGGAASGEKKIYFLTGFTGLSGFFACLEDREKLTPLRGKNSYDTHYFQGVGCVCLYYPVNPVDPV